MNSAIFAGILGIGALSSALAQAQTDGTKYDAVSDFNLNSNPSGPWTYYDDDKMHDHLLGSSEADYKQTAGLNAWTNGKNTKDAAYIARNTTHRTVYFESIALPKNELAVNGGAADGVELDFTVPEKGNYRLR